MVPVFFYDCHLKNTKLLSGLYGAEHKSKPEKKMVFDEDEKEENEYLEKLAHWKKGMIFYVF